MQHLFFLLIKIPLMRSEHFNTNQRGIFFIFYSLLSFLFCVTIYKYETIPSYTVAEKPRGPTNEITLKNHCEICWFFITLQFFDNLLIQQEVEEIWFLKEFFAFSVEIQTICRVGRNEIEVFCFKVVSFFNHGSNNFTCF